MLSGMRITIDIRDDVLRQAKKKAADEGATLRQVLESALQAYLTGPSGQREYRLSWRTEQGRILPGVNLDDRTSLLDLTSGQN